MIPSAPRQRTQRSASSSVRGPTLFGTLHSLSKEEQLGEDAKQSVAVPDRGRMPFPEHVRQYFKQLEWNVAALESLFKRVGTFTQTEAFMAGSKATILFRAQHEVVGQLVRCCDAEIEFLSKKLADSEHRSRAAFESPKQKSDQVGWNSVYCSLTALGRICGAARGAVFVIPSDCVVTSGTDFARSLKLAAFVSSTKLTPLDKGALHADILDIASTVAATRCSVNAKAIVDSRRGKHGFSTILACPILNPKGSGSPFGVVALMDKIPPPGGCLTSKLFSVEDEARLSHGAEALAEILDSFGLISSSTTLSFISPTNFENTWNVGTHDDTVLRRVFQDPAPRGYIFRDDGVAPATAARRAEMASSRQRVMISHSSQLVDTLKRCEELEDELLRLRSKLSEKESGIDLLENRLADVVREKERTDKHADSMRLANELILRNTFVIANQTRDPISVVDDTNGIVEVPVVRKVLNTHHVSMGPQSSRRTHLM
ncbi:Hypothetical protein, putative [Bodo saltans]|uniref:GAF domain-containing protein n=1 Tax=Bodo saltans TaxID=75058 RepID=A0A0S4IV69_BODSA|nr:Hypothetical protein, putative [Bodo saltans]|eukprot:CUG15761.1 Hypothetical protein, putative [Bodo saltans]